MKNVRLEALIRPKGGKLRCELVHMGSTQLYFLILFLPGGLTIEFKQDKLRVGYPFGGLSDNATAAVI